MATNSAVSILVLHRTGFDDVFEACDKVLTFANSKGQEFRDQFAGCTAKSIPYGTYEVSVSSQTFKYTPRRTCVIGAPHSACVVDTPDPDFSDWDVELRLRGFEQNSGAGVVFVRSVYSSAWQTAIPFRGNQEITFHTAWRDLHLAIMWNGASVGAGVINLRRSHTLQVEIDLKAESVRLVPIPRPAH